MAAAPFLLRVKYFNNQKIFSVFSLAAYTITGAMLLLRKTKKKSAQLLSLPAYRMMAAQARLPPSRVLLRVVSLKRFSAATVCAAWLPPSRVLLRVVSFKSTKTREGCFEGTKEVCEGKNNSEGNPSREGGSIKKSWFLYAKEGCP